MEAKSPISPANHHAVILHVDMDAFFVSVEELYDPSLRGKPVIVGGKPNQRGVVAAASYAARRFGVHSAMPLTQAARLCPKAIFLPGRRERYSAASRQIKEIFQKFSPRVEMVSVDEAYLNLTGSERLFGSPLRAAHLLHDEIARDARLPCSIGVSTTRLVSKIASDQAKPNGVLWIMPGTEAAFLAPLPVGKIPGVGKVTEKELRKLGVRRVGDLARLGRDILESKLGRYGAALFAKAQGNQEREGVLAGAEWGEEWEAEDHDRAKSIGHEETFGEDLADPVLLEATLADLSQRVAARLRQQGLYARTITLKLRYASFQTLTRAQTLAEPTNLDGGILDTARRLFRRNWNRKRKVRLLGVQASGLSDRAGQANLLTASADQKWGRAMAAADRLRSRFGFASVQLATALPTTVLSPTNAEQQPEAASRKPLTRKQSTQKPLARNYAHED
ncbi:MAG: DNA polymerase IV [Candidatus Acidiferrales bacterium]